ncbi:YiaA/YiaB family inner membrane protein [Xanthocytophaga agilis]|uniref:YiaA/YiaB family inner membrane protein n=1 Tax=Xanthocytophaga agilis TaxID=3048010 RepID=A0AAE3UEW7_9BACT|nr:YiaA/YiaB family inner membrane protein [Xanthocytophaga agilis]MDJ1503203.1 YiaA/YiaB family inner membrane protein [Xanthocytophaga agilis]
MESKNTVVNKPTPMYRFQVWSSFVLSFSLMVIGIYHLPVEIWIKGYLIMGIIFTVGSCFTLAKTIRDDFESEKIEGKKYENS